jgi:hypothetical protein
VSTSPKGLLELVGEFFEVRAQVDRDLTTVSRVDRRLGLIKNLGRHRRGRERKAGRGRLAGSAYRRHRRTRQPRARVHSLLPAHAAAKARGRRNVF